MPSGTALFSVTVTVHIKILLYFYVEFQIYEIGSKMHLIHSVALMAVPLAKKPVLVSSIVYVQVALQREYSNTAEVYQTISLYCLSIYVSLLTL